MICLFMNKSYQYFEYIYRSFLYFFFVFISSKNVIKIDVISLNFINISTYKIQTKNNKKKTSPNPHIKKILINKYLKTQQLLNLKQSPYINISIRQKMNPQKKLKLILASLKDRQIIKFFQAFSANFSDQIKKSVRQISFNCYQSVCQFKNKIVSGYGKNSQESYVNSIRTLVQLLADDQKLHSVMRQSLRFSQQSPSTNNCQSQKKLSYIQKQTSYSMKNTSTNCPKPIQKKSTLKQQIFEYLNLDNLKISNPNATHKTKPHDKYLNPTNQDDDPTLEQIFKMNKQLEEKIRLAREENARLKNEIKLSKVQTQTQTQSQSQNHMATPLQTQGYTQTKQNQQTNQYTDIGDENQINKNIKQRVSYTNMLPRQTQALKPRNDYLNQSQDPKIQKSKIRSVSVQAGQCHKYNIPKSANEKKITVPKLNLQVLPNYHGKSNKSLNQSLMEVYQKTHAK